MPLIIFLIFVFVWYFPVYCGQGKTERLSHRTVPIAILTGMIPVFAVVLLIQIGLGRFYKLISVSGMLYTALDAFVSAALVEEFVKFVAGYLIVRKTKPQRGVDYVLIFGAVGLGYEVTETLLQLDSVIAGIVRGVFALHIIWQFWMGLYYWKFRDAKRLSDSKSAVKNITLAFVVPIVLHGMNDFLLFVIQEKMKAGDSVITENVSGMETVIDEESMLLWVGALLLFMVIEIVFQIVTFRKALREARKSRASDFKEPN